MSTAKLLDQLLEIERAVGHADVLSIRRMLMDAQSQVLGIQEDLVSMLAEMRALRERAAAERTAVASPRNFPPSRAIAS